MFLLELTGLPWLYRLLTGTTKPYSGKLWRVRCSFAVTDDILGDMVEEGRKILKDQSPEVFDELRPDHMPSYSFTLERMTDKQLKGLQDSEYIIVSSYQDRTDVYANLDEQDVRRDELVKEAKDAFDAGNNDKGRDLMRRAENFRMDRGRRSRMSVGDVEFYHKCDPNELDNTLCWED